MDNISNKKHIVIIGGMNSGITAATRIRRLNENVEITIIDKCSYIAYPISAIPDYISGSIKSIDSLIYGYEDNLTKIYNVNIIKNCEVKKIDREKKILHYKNLKTYIENDISYNKLILACGHTIKHIRNKDFTANNLFFLRTLDDAIKIKNFIDDFSIKKISLYCSNYISIQLAISLIKNGFSVSIITESSDLEIKFDKEFNFLLKDQLIKKGVKIYFNSKIEKLLKKNNNFIYEIETTKGNIETQMLIICGELIPNYYLANECGLKITKNNGINVNEQMETNDPDIYAIGGVCESFNYITNKGEISYSNYVNQIQARIAGTNIFNNNEQFKGIITDLFFKFNDYSVGIVGLSEDEAKRYNYDILIINLFCGQHERFVSDAQQLYFKVIIDKDTKRIIGAQISGKSYWVNKNLDIISTIIYSNIDVFDMENLIFSYSPEVNNRIDPINMIAMIATNRLKGLSISTSLKEIELFNNENTYILDIRNKNEREKTYILNSKWIPLEEIRNRIREIPYNKNIYIYDNNGKKSYIAERILRSYGFTNVQIIDGGISLLKIYEDVNF